MIEVFGYLGEPSEEARRAVADAGLVAASARALETLGVPAGRRLVLGPVDPAIEALAAYERAGAPDGPAVALASGDPLFYGVVRRFRQAGLECRVHAGVSSIAAAFAAVALPWDDAQVVSAHGHGLGPALAACRALPKVAVLTAAGRGVREIAAGLADVERWYVVAERLGEADERVRVLDGAAALAVADVAEPNVVLVLAAPPDAREMPGTPTAYVGGPRPPAGPPPWDRATRHAGRALALAVVLGRHAPALGDTVWTAGTLAGPVAAWCARTGAAVVDLDTLPGAGAGTGELPAYLADADLAILDDPAWLSALAGRFPRVIAVLADDAAADRTAAAVDAAGLPESATVTIEHLASTSEDGVTSSTYLTIIERPREPS